MLLRSIKIQQKVQRNSMTHCEWPESMFHKSIKITCRKLKADINKKPKRSNVLFLDFSTCMYCASLNGAENNNHGVLIGLSLKNKIV